MCVSGQVDVTAQTSNNLKFNFDIPTNQSGLTDTFLSFVTSGGPFQQQIQAGSQKASGTFSIGATLCVPCNNSSPSAVQILTHGIGFDRYYWDFTLGYSYVDVATSNGFAVLMYDRLGVGTSEKADPLNQVQAALQVEIAASLTRSLRSGKLSGLKFPTIIGGGHSFGSIITQAITNQYPKLLQGAILTGFALNTTALPVFLNGLNLQIARENSPYRFSDLNNGYIVAQSAISNQIGFFRAPGFDPKILAMAEAAKGTTTYGELFSVLAVTAPATSFTGPVVVVNGQEDLPFCFGNCSYPMDLSQFLLSQLYPSLNSAKTTTYVAKNTGHGINLHYSSHDAFVAIHDFLAKQGILS